MKKNRNLFQLTITSMLIAILIVQTFVPLLGYIPIGPIDVTIVHITVILSAVLFGPKTGLIIGFIWGFLSMSRAYLQPTPFNVVFLNPVISVLPRLIVGWASGMLYKFLKIKKIENISYAITAAVGTLMNTVLVLGSIYLFASQAYADALGISESLLLKALGTVVVTNGTVEIITSIIILPLLAIPLSKFLSKKNQNL